jgi:hypothetical protein
MKRDYITVVVILLLLILAIGGSYFSFKKGDGTFSALRVFTVEQGGTGTAVSPNLGDVLVGLSDGTYEPRATSTLGIGGSGSGVSDWLQANGALTPSTTIGIRVKASSTITGLTVDSDATTTGKLIVQGTATSTFVGGIDVGSSIVTAHGSKAFDSSGFHIHSSNGTGVAYFGVAGGSNSTFEGGVNIDGATRLATSLSGLLYVNTGAVLATATGTLTTTATGLEFSATRGLVGGASVLSLTSGYVVPTTTRANNWDTAFSWGNHALAGYDQVTTAGDGLTRTVNDFDCDTASGTVFGCLSSANWTTFNNKQDTITAGDALTLTGTDIDFDGGATPSGDLGGTWASPSVTDDSHAHTGTTLSGIDISADTNLSADGTEIVLTGDALSLGTALTFTTGTSTTSFQTGLLGVGTDYISDITGTGLSITNGVLNVTSSGGDGVSNWTFSGTTLSPSTTPVGISVATTTITVNAIATGVTDGLIVKNTTAATAGVPKQYSPEIVLSGTAYRSIDTSSNVKSWSIQAQPQNGSTDLDNILDITDVGGSRVLRLSSNEGGGGYVAVGGTSIYSYSLVPGFNNGGVLGSTALQWSDLFLAEGGVINWDNGDATLTQSGNTVTLAGAGFNTTNATSTASFFSALGTFTNLVINTLATFLDVVVTGLLDVGGGVLEIPNGAAPTVDSIGEIAIDSTSNQLVLYGSAKKVYGDGNFYPSFTYATSTAWTGTTTIPLGAPFTDETWNAVKCFTDVGTVNVDFGDGTNFMNATTSKAVNPVPTHTLSSNNTFTSGETRYARVGTPASSPTKVSCTVSKSITAD